MSDDHPISIPGVAERLEERARAWGVAIESTRETAASRVAFGWRRGVAVALKVVRRPGDEWRSGEVLQAFGGRGMVRVYEQVEGAMLIERLRPATPLAAASLAGRDDEATDVLADVIARMEPLAPPPGCATVERWGRGFARYLATADARGDSPRRYCPRSGPSRTASPSPPTIPRCYSRKRSGRWSRRLHRPPVIPLHPRRS
jgi:hypothetical protein